MIEEFPKKEIIKKYIKTEKKRQKLADAMINAIHSKVKSSPRLIINYIIDDKIDNSISKTDNYVIKTKDIIHNKFEYVMDQIAIRIRAFENELFYTMIDIKPERRRITKKYFEELYINFKYKKIICSTKCFFHFKEILNDKKVSNRVDQDNFLVTRYAPDNKILLFLKGFAVMFVGLTIKIKMIGDKYIILYVENKLKLHTDLGCCKIIETIK